MKQSEAVRHIRALRRTIQRAQTNLRDPLMGFAEDDPIQKAAETLMPWIFGPTSLLDVVVKVEDMIDAGKELVPLDFYNLMAVAWRLQPQLVVLPALIQQGEKLPEPSIDWIAGWEPETATSGAIDAPLVAVEGGGEGEGE